MTLILTQSANQNTITTHETEITNPTMAITSLHIMHQVGTLMEVAVTGKHITTVL